MSHQRPPRPFAAHRRRPPPTDLHPAHSLNLAPTVIRLRAAADLLQDDGLWIAVTLSGDEHDEDDLRDAVLIRWTTLVLQEDDLRFLREALTLNATGRDEDDLEPLE